MKKTKAQSAIEFIILVGVVLFFFIGFLYAVNVNLGERARDEKRTAVRDIALIIQDEVALASKSSDGYRRSFEVSDKILGSFDYNVDITEGFVYVRTSDGDNAIALSVLNVSGNVQKGINSIKKDSGQVYLNQ